MNLVDSNILAKRKPVKMQVALDIDEEARELIISYETFPGFYITTKIQYNTIESYIETTEE